MLLLNTRETVAIEHPTGRMEAVITTRRAGNDTVEVLGGGTFSSRLFEEVREKRGLAYSVYSFMMSHVDTGMFGVYAGVLQGGAQRAHQFLGILLDAVGAFASRGNRNVGLRDLVARGIEQDGAAGVAALVERQDEAVAQRHHRRRLAAKASTRSRTAMVST